MKRSLLARLRSNGISYIVAAAILLLGIPLYQTLVLGPTGFTQAQSNTGGGRYIAYLNWISTHTSSFLIDRGLLIIAFILLFSFPYALYRIIVAQEIMYQQELEESDDDAADDDEFEDDEQDKDIHVPEASEESALPAQSWRGKSFVVLAIWLSIIGLIIYLVSLVASTGYLLVVGNSTSIAVRESVGNYLPLLSIITNTLGTGLLGMGVLFFGAMIARTGKNLWPTSWVLFAYIGLFVGAILCISAVAIFSAPGNGQSTLTTLATLLFALWLLWFAITLVRLKAEP